MNPERARVSSVEAIERFRARLIIYRDKIKPLLADAGDEVSRTREWLRMDRRAFWENEARRRKRHLEEIQQSYFSARFSKLRPATSADQAALHRAEKSLAEAEQKLDLIKHWSIAFEQRAGPLLKQLEQLRSIVLTDLSQGEEHLARIIEKLDLYIATPIPRTPTANPDARHEPVQTEANIQAAGDS